MTGAPDSDYCSSRRLPSFPFGKEAVSKPELALSDESKSLVGVSHRTGNQEHRTSSTRQPPTRHPRLVGECVLNGSRARADISRQHLKPRQSARRIRRHPPADRSH